MQSKIRVEVQHFEGCPNGPVMLGNVLKAISNFGNQVEFVETHIETPEDAITNKFRGSPTLLINGADFENMPEPPEPRLSCRFYPNGVPPVERITERIRSLTGK
ncbi:MAG: hypothetical protein HW421_3107 [Ignavibacteria bacterium]|nr:hypothetical protein [Ignavibacteria bacterium]